MIHSSDNTKRISKESFKDCCQDIGYFDLAHYEELSGWSGYNFAFAEDSLDAENAAEHKKYGLNAVFF